MDAAFYSSCVIACRNNNRNHAIHNTFIICCRTEWICSCKSIGRNKFIYIFFSAKILFFDAYTCSGQSVNSIIRQNLQIGFTACNFFCNWCCSFNHGIDGLGSHGITYIDDQMNDHHWTDHCFNCSDFNICASAAK